MLKVLEANELPLETKSAPNESQKRSRGELRAAIDAALAANPDRTDREIARICGVDHNTVAVRRAEIPQSTQVGKFGAENSPPAAPVPQSERGKDFSWRDAEDDGDIVVPEQAAIAVYVNLSGNVVVRQEGRFGVDEDHWIVIHPSNAEVLANAILRAARVII
jgi:hypothetical protein